MRASAQSRARAAGTTEVTLRNRLKGLEETLRELVFDGVLGTVVTIVIGPYKRCPWTGL